MERYGLIGAKLGHSFSKIIHEEIMDYEYDLIELNEEELEVFFKEKNFSAVNVTIPYKQTVIKWLDVVDEKARKINAVNTVVNRDGKLYGYNTDYYGIVSLLNRNKVEVKDKNVLILGTGGTSNTAYAVFEDLGAKSINKVSRTKRNNSLSYEEAYELKDTQIIFNSTPSGMYPHNEDCPIDINQFPNLEAVMDAIYNPLRTNLVLMAKDRGLKAEGGLYMLVAQAVKAIEYFKDINLDVSVLDTTFNKIYKEKENIVLIGMPGCGKTTISKKLKTAKKLIDADEEIVKNTAKTIPDIFKEVGEKGFRDIEEETIKGIAKNSSQIIATGGGVILRKNNINNLKQNGKVFYLKTPLDKLQTGNGRPLSSDREALEKRYAERKELYEKYADTIIDNEFLEHSIEVINAYEN
ncbi:MAG: shikimate kinase [Erysipelotrichaceae bacterium]|nr:shikimate kinase [Erysipelotrichaceae bacterium]